jgi:hypothetical protein
VVMRSIVGLDCTIQNVEPQQLERKWVKGSLNVCATRGDYRKWRSSGGLESPDSINQTMKYPSREPREESVGITLRKPPEIACDVIRRALSFKWKSI